jgi:hypothetical protein
MNLEQQKLSTIATKGMLLLLHLSVKPTGVSSSLASVQKTKLASNLNLPLDLFFAGDTN